jgi:prenyltransferase beta subunit
MNHRPHRRRFLAGTAALAVGAGVPAWARGFDRRASKDEKSPAELIDAKTQRAIDRGLEYLARRQVKSGPNQGAFGQTGYAAGVATTALSGLAFMCGGHSPGEGKYGKNVDGCVEFLLRNVGASGYISRTDQMVHENMYGHGFALLFLAQAYGMTMKAEIGEKLRRAVKLTCACQNAQGGWRYQPQKSDADLSITVCQIMGLRAARDAGVEVPDEVRAKCIEYVQKSQNGNGSFRYTLDGGHATFAMTAAGVTSLYSANIYEGDAIERALKYLVSNRSEGEGYGHYFYAHYYAVQAMWHAGGKYWNEWYPSIRDELVNRQSDSGAWNASEACDEFGTAMACIILQIPLNLVPVFAP